MELTNTFSPTAILSSGSSSPFVSYFQQLHQLLISVIVATKSGQKLSPDEGSARAVEIIEAVTTCSGKVMIIGNGGSAAIASHKAIDLWNAAGVPAITFNDPAQLTCLSNDFGYEFVFSKAIEMFAQPQDVLIAISSSGKSPNILNAVGAAQNKGCKVITFAGFKDNAPLLSCGDLNFYIDSTQYGPVEIAHLSLIHYLTDLLCAKRKGAPI